MARYGVSWREIWFGWTAGQVFLFLRRLLEQQKEIEKARKGRGRERRLSENDLKGSPWLQG